MDRVDQIGACQGEQLVVALQFARRIGQPVAAEISLLEVVALDHRAHRPVDHQDALAQVRLDFVIGVGQGHVVSPREN